MEERFRLRDRLLDVRDLESLAAKRCPHSGGSRWTWRIPCIWLDAEGLATYDCKMLEEVKKKLQAEVEALNHELHVVLPETLKKALAMGDLRENGDYHAAIERQQFIQARLSHLRSRLGKLSNIDLSQVPGDRVGLGSTVRVRDMSTKAEETWELVISDAMDVDEGQVSVASPLGRGLMDKKVGETATVQLPAGKRKLKILGLTTLHDQVSRVED